MPEYRRGAHTVFEIHLHLVWITKYRRPALTGEVATRVRDLTKDHVHLFVSIPPQVTISRLWARGYFCCSSGNVTDEMIAKYIAEQNLDQDEDFRVDG